MKTKRKIAAFALLSSFAIAVGIFIVFLAKPQVIKLNGGLGKIIAKQKSGGGFFKNIEKPAALEKG